jgi:hypothetical protein
MLLTTGAARALLLAVVLLATPTSANAARMRFHYAATDGCGNMSLKAADPCGAPGERISFLGTVRDPVCAPPRPTHFASFQHPYTGRAVVVPVCLPEGAPRMEYRSARTIYNYGSYTVEVHFLMDGTVDVVYNSGLLRGF